MKGKSKKPAKPIAGQSKTQYEDPSVYGHKVKYMGFKSCPSICKKCGRITIRGMIRVLNEKDYCSVGCATSDK